MEKVNHPDHYGGDTTFEAINVIVEWGHHKSFCIGNALKYLCRMGKKNSETTIIDLKKAIWYLNKQLEIYEYEQQTVKDFIRED